MKDCYSKYIPDEVLNRRCDKCESCFNCISNLNGGISVHVQLSVERESAVKGLAYTLQLEQAASNFLSIMRALLEKHTWPCDKEVLALEKCLSSKRKVT
jgi:hypothetical protein